MTKMIQVVLELGIFFFKHFSAFEANVNTLKKASKK